MKMIAHLLLACLLGSCNYTISMAHTEGAASDVIDDTASNQPNVSPTVTIPAKLM